jgi:2-hydroxy-6-oxonona-2,4-dienedioate hydrolase
MRVQFIDVDGVRTRCLTAGADSAYPLLLLHGYGGTADVWIRNIDVLARDFRVIAVDLIGSGFTAAIDTRGGPPQPHTVAHLRRLADLLGLERFCPIGTSYGGLIAALLYFDMPERVDNLVLQGSGSCFNEDEALAATLRNVRSSFGPIFDNATLDAVRKSMAKLVVDASTVPEEAIHLMATAYAQPGMRHAWEMGLDGLLDFEASRPYRVLQRLESLAARTLVLWGRQDPGAVYASAVAGVKRMPNAKLVTFENCGHKPMFEYPEQFNSEIRAFLKGELQ